jgi:2-polyprenyl-3-methyl-5-hydroxy-6-metoxy-1,4-benzoquinol methylase
MSCTVCESSDLREVRAAEITRLEEVSFSYTFSPEHGKTFRVVRCRRCTHQFCEPLPTDLTSSYHDVVDEEYIKHAESRRLAAQAVLRLVQKYLPSGRLLDVGCATGDFLDEARRLGYETEGLELSRWSCNLARQRGLVVHEEPLDRFAAHNAGRFEIVSLIGVIEHFPNPRTEMANLARLLKPGGLVVLWTGDASSLLARALGHKWWYWQGQHVQYFTHKSLMRLAEEAGFEHVTTARYPFAATHTTLSNSLRRYRLHRLISAVLRPLFRVRPVIYLRLPGEMLFVARRRG